MVEKLERLENDSIPPDARKLISLKQSSYRIRVGDYRILYRIEKDSIVVFSINKRSVVYKR
ncbi:MAG: type II toxin-antitoxin system RelE/ParE family toxin [Candidatus Methanofastidiosum sp.]|nr:type II toxin-antitoxin system RelE/ParE family toxin [Methanofastidiosum sp.]